ncbi:MAG: AmmeMemoRadiSam system protein B [Ignavibacteria bacterium]|nr:AmmeMemoRadiSam system protein B [Ignavibacteria bacterium]
MKSDRQPAVAGLFYSGPVTELTDEIDYYLNKAAVQVAPAGPVRGMVVPHAGYVYSGLTAAHAFTLLKEQPVKTVFIIAPSHREYFTDMCIYEGDSYVTPLGKVPVHKEIRQDITSRYPQIRAGVNGHRAEHSIEVQLPFLQRLLPEFSFIPIVMGEQSAANISLLAEAIQPYIGTDTIILASSDLSHFYPRGIAETLDEVVANYIAQTDYQGLQTSLNKGECEACGGGLIVSLMQALAKNGRTRSNLLHQTDSGAVSGDTTEVVGYLSAAFY